MQKVPKNTKNLFKDDTMKEILFLEMHECTVMMAPIRTVKSWLSFLLKNLSCSTVPGKEVFSKYIDNKVKIFHFLKIIAIFSKPQAAKNVL
jgi:hypothetical protein